MTGLFLHHARVDEWFLDDGVGLDEGPFRATIGLEGDQVLVDEDIEIALHVPFVAIDTAGQVTDRLDRFGVDDGDEPIDIERFEDGPEEALRAGGPTNAESLLAFLAEHADQAFAPKEIHEATVVPRGSVGVVLSRLEERGLVRHRGEYWAVTRDADVETTLAALSTARTASERLGPEDPEEWGPGMESGDG